MTRSEMKRVDGILHMRGIYEFNDHGEMLYITFDKDSRTMPYSLRFCDTDETIACAANITYFDFLLEDRRNGK